MRIAIRFTTGKVSKREFKNSFQWEATIIMSEKAKESMLQNSELKIDFPKIKTEQSIATIELPRLKYDKYIFLWIFLLFSIFIFCKIKSPSPWGGLISLISLKIRRIFWFMLFRYELKNYRGAIIHPGSLF